MRKRKFLVLLTALALVLASLSGLSGCSGAGSEIADRVWTNGVVYTADAENTFVEAVAVKDGKILAAGPAADVEKFIGDGTEVTDLAGKLVLPAMTDSHLHAPGTMLSQLFQIDLNGVLTEEETVKTIQDYVTAHPDMDIYYGSGFSVGAFSGEEVSKGPKKERLDEITDKPVIIGSYDGHTVWMNSAAFTMCGITKDTVPPEGGVIEKTADGELWGTLKELALGLVPEQEFTEEQVAEAHASFQDYLHSLGYVGITNMSSGITIQDAPDPFVEMDKNGALKLYVTRNIVMDPNADFVPQIENAKEFRDAYQSEFYKATSLKFFADGVVEGVTGYLLEPYTAEAGAAADFVSEALWDPQTMKDAFTLGNKEGFQIHVHSIGDAASRQTLDAFQAAWEAKGEGDYRNVMTHLQLVDPADIPRFAEYKIIASTQPYWALKEPYWWEVVDQPLLGTERAEREYPMQSFVNAGVTLVSSSDHSVTPFPNPFWAIEAGVTRNLNNAEYYGVDDITDMDDPTWLLNKEERVSLTDMVKSFTINAAFQNFREDTTGSIEVGKSGDLIVVDQNIFEINPIQIDKTQVLETVLKGETVYQSK